MRGILLIALFLCENKQIRKVLSDFYTYTINVYMTVGRKKNDTKC